MKNIFSKGRPVPQTYRPVMEASEVIELFGRLTMHQQAALMRLMSRNLVVELNSESAMGYDLDYDVEGAMIVARPAEPEPLSE